MDVVTKLFDELKLSNISDPEKAWTKLKGGIKKFECEPMSLDTPIFDNKIRVVCLSDTHSLTPRMTHKIPQADILIHAGDFTRRGTINEIESFNEFLSSLHNIKYKIVIAGNHEVKFDSKFDSYKNESQNAKSLLKNCFYLEDSSIDLYGYTFYGSPWQPYHVGNAFQFHRGERLRRIWNQIPIDTDVLITHGPPLGFGDHIYDLTHVGCVDLLDVVRNKIKPKYHIFGHIHEGYGYWSDGVTKYINASICNENYKPINKPILFDLDMPENISK